MKATTTLWSVLFSLAVLPACGGSKFKAGTAAIAEGVGSLTGDGDSGSSSASSEEASSGDVTATLGSSEETSSPGSESTSPVLVKAPGWSLECGGDLFRNVFPGAQADESDDAKVASLALGGWGSVGGGSSSRPESSDQASILASLDDCMDADLKQLATKGVKYAVLKFDPSSNQVTEAKPFDRENFPGKRADDHNACARVAGVKAANVVISKLAELVSRSGLAGLASCSASTCCIKFR